MIDPVPAAPAAPPAASVVFGDRLPVLQAYAQLLATAGVERGLLGPREAPRLWERHLLNCAGLAELLQPGEVVADLGAGAGLPGLVLAAARPDLQVVLVEPLLRRADFLAEAVALLELPHATVRRARAEELVGELAVDAVVARAVAPLDRLAGWALPLLRPEGRLLALKGDRAEQEVAQATSAISRAGGSRADVVTVGRQDLATWARVVVIARGTPPGGSPGSGTSSRPTTTSRTTRTRRGPGGDPAPRRLRRDPGTSAAGRAASSSAGSPPSADPSPTPVPSRSSTRARTSDRTSSPRPSSSTALPPQAPPSARSAPSGPETATSSARIAT